jgi:hypothetical protein
MWSCDEKRMEKGWWSWDEKKTEILAQDDGGLGKDVPFL